MLERGAVLVTRSLVLCVCFVDRCLPFLHLAIVLSVLLRFMDSDYLFGIFKLVLFKFSNILKEENEAWEHTVCH